MNRVIVLMICVLFAFAATAQNVAIGGRMGDVKVKEWLGDKPASGKAQLVTFFHSSSPSSIAQLAELDKLAAKFPAVNFIVLSKESEQAIGRYLPAKRNYLVGLDDAAKTFSALEIDFVPFSVLADARGRVLWFGATPTEKIISDNLK